jgi:hypothetical protein
LAWLLNFQNERKANIEIMPGMNVYIHWDAVEDVVGLLDLCTNSSRWDLVVGATKRLKERNLCSKSVAIEKTDEIYAG